MPPAELTGNGSGSGEPIYARAALLGDESGRPTIDASLLTTAYRRFRLGEEAIDLILVASDAALALLTSLPPGLTLAGVVSEEPIRQPLSTKLPYVTGVTGAIRQIADGDLLILDPEAGRVLVEPAPEEFALLQTERRRPRFQLGDTHTPAQTQAGRRIDVWATVKNATDIDEAIAGGADGLLVVDVTEFLSEDDEGQMDPTLLLRIADRIGGGDLALVADPDEIDPAVLFAVAPRADLRWVLRPDRLGQSPDELRLDLQQFVSDSDDDNNSTGASPRSVSFPSLCALEISSAASNATFDELYLPAAATSDWTIADTFGLPPLRILLADDDFEGLERAVLLGAAGVAVAPGQIAATKDFIREQAY